MLQKAQNRNFGCKVKMVETIRVITTIFRKGLIVYLRNAEGNHNPCWICHHQQITNFPELIQHRKIPRQRGLSIVQNHEKYQYQLLHTKRYMKTSSFAVYNLCIFNFYKVFHKADQPVTLPLMAPGVEELQFPHLKIPVSIESIIPVLPACPVPAADGDTLYLSNLDDAIGVRVFTPTVYFYRSKGRSPSQKPVVSALRDALASVLVPYYPFSGRLREAKNGKLEVFFGPQQGVLFIEAQTEMSLADLGDVTVPNPAWTALIYKFPDEEPYKVLDMPLIIAQVTQFGCGGFSLGLRMCHCLSDGLGAMQFLSAWAATAKAGSLVVNPMPCWDRENFRPRNSPKVQFPHKEYKRILDGSTLTRRLWEVKPIQKCYRISRDYQARLKTLAQAVGDLPCTTFDAMAAHVWRSFVQALDVKPLDFELRLTFSVNARPKLKNQPLNDGFYGNALCVACATSTVCRLVNGCLSDTTRLIRQARLSVSEEYVRSTIDYIEVDRPRNLEFGGKLTITQWTRFSIYDCTDFGWGRPIYAGPIDLTPTPQVCIFLPEGGADSEGAMLLCICLPESASRRFGELLLLKDSINGP